MLGPDEAEGCKMTELGVLRGTVVLEPGLPGGPEGLARMVPGSPGELGRPSELGSPDEPGSPGGLAGMVPGSPGELGRPNELGSPE